MGHNNFVMLSQKVLDIHDKYYDDGYMQRDYTMRKVVPPDEPCGLCPLKNACHMRDNENPRGSSELNRMLNEYAEKVTLTFEDSAWIDRYPDGAFLIVRDVAQIFGLSKHVLLKRIERGSFSAPDVSGGRGVPMLWKKETVLSEFNRLKDQKGIAA